MLADFLHAFVCDGYAFDDAQISATTNLWGEWQDTDKTHLTNKIHLILLAVSVQFLSGHYLPRSSMQLVCLD